ncbi:MAG: transporter [Sphingomonas bacterium]|uniref:MFS transporter n=1 Tax=Sphingomonas bacterium TaxID=1895847 RepID=UPI002604F4FC|nr:MFS transporter [Sphingomonas bacterium]MDB5706783.1 transporter [Sphingomonas bacterium]
MAESTMPGVADAAAARVGRYRWVICGLLFAATAINYVDRQMLGVLKETLHAEVGWTEIGYSNVVFWFQTAYAIGYLGFGKLVDRIGARFGYAIAFVIWTIAHMAHGGVHSVTQFAMVRFGLGIGESGNFPAGVKAVTEWFPAKERALAVGIFNAGANVGAIVTPLIVPALTLAYGWRMAFVITGAASMIWLVAWLVIYRRPTESTKVSAAELAYIQSDPADPVAPMPWLNVLFRRETWAFALGKFFIDPIWWMYIFWLPDFLGKSYHLDLKTFGPPLVAVYVLSDVGSVLGGWASSRMIKNGRTVNFARKSTMFVCALCVTPIFFAQWIDNLWLAVLIIGVAAAAHQAFSANVYTLPSDLFPRSAVGSVIGIGGTVGAIGGMIFSLYIGQILARIGTYTPIFIVAGCAYFVALAAIHLLSPKLARAETI